MKLWMEVTNDEYELPVCVADTAAELARKRGYRCDTTIYAAIRNCKRFGYKCRFIKVEVEDEPEID